MRHGTFGTGMYKWLLLCFVGGALTGCGAYYQPVVPPVESYLPSPPPERLHSPSDEAEMEAEEEPLEEIGEGRAAVSLETCVRIALDKNPSMRAAEAGVRVAKEGVGEARAPYFPDVGISTGYHRFQRHAFLPNGLTDIRSGIPSVIGPTDDWNGAVNSRFILFDSGERRAQLKSAMARQGVAEEEAARIQQDLAFNVHQTYYGLVAAMENRDVARKNLELAENHLHLAQERKAAGAVPKADVLRAQVEVADRRLALVRAENLVRITQGQLSTSMGLPVETHFEVDARPEEMISPQAIDLDAALGEAVHVRPEIKAALRRVASAGTAVESAKSAFGPKIKAEAGYGWRDSEFLPQDEEWLAGVFVELPLFTGFSRIHKLAGKKAELSKEEATARQVVLDVQREVWTAHSEFKEAYEAVQASEVLVKDAEEGMRTTQERYEVGADTINDLLDAQTALARAETSRVEARWNYHIARSAFDRSIGRMAVE